MLDKTCSKLLKILKNLCKENGYSIIEIVEILDGFSNKLELELLKTYINYLAENEYIDVKYIDDKQICLAIMPKANSLVEEKKEKKIYDKKYIRMGFFVALASMVFSFIGAFLGSFLFEVLR